MVPTALEVNDATDLELVDRMQARDADAVGQLYDRYCAPLFAVAYRITANRVDAEEAVLLTFTQAWNTVARFDGRRGSVGAWLTMIVRSRSLDLARADKRRDALADQIGREEPSYAGLGSVSPTPETSLEADERRRHVQSALAALPASQRRAIELAFYEGLSQSQIAAKLQTPLGTIKTRIRDGMKKLRDVLHPHYATGSP